MRIGILAADPVHEQSRARPDGGSFLAQGLHRLEATNRAVSSVLEGDGHTVVSLPVNPGLLLEIARAAPDLVFNTYFGPARREDQGHVASLLDYAGVPFSGGGAACHFVGLSKPLSKHLFSALGFPTSGFFVAATPLEATYQLQGTAVKLPLLVKVSGEGEGIGLDDQSLVTTRGELQHAVGRVMERFGQSALVEEFLPGREFTVGVLDGEKARVLPILEIMVPADRIFSFAAKAGEEFEEVCPAALSPSEAELIGQIAVRAGRSMGCRDCWRVDFRMGEDGSPRLLEVNTLPGLQPGYSDIPKMIEPAGMSYADLVRTILESAGRRSRRRAHLPRAPEYSPGGGPSPGTK
jgi:D-alanine--D-alanine ligase